jgi:UDP-2,3-diacylglucosamine pyrophosphatase LpxH
MPNRYLVVSDLHLTDVEDHPDGWKYFKGSRYLFDEEIGELVDRFLAQTPEKDDPTLVLNGDILDFDLLSPTKDEAPFKVSAVEKRWGLKPTPKKSVWKLERILRCHERFLDALLEVLARGGEVVYVLGNHDRELHFPEVRQAFLAALESRASASGVDVSLERLRFEPWFYYVPREIYAEHGQQYDFYTSYRYVLSPIIELRRSTQIALPMGNISNRYLMSRMGYFNPHATDYILNIFSYIAHWLRYYAFSRRSLALSWFVGSLVVMKNLLKTKSKRLRKPKHYDKLLDAQAARYELTREQVDRLHELRQPPITNRFFKIIREFWIDRVALTVLMVGGTIALALVPIPLWIKLMVPLTGFPLLFFIYETILKGESVLVVERDMPRNARYIADVLDVAVVTFGHTHIPRLLPMRHDVTFVDTGTWAPITGSSESRALKKGYRNYLICAFAEGRPRIEYTCWPTPATRRGESAEAD